jgi:hypothetical protein
MLAALAPSVPVVGRRLRGAARSALLAVKSAAVAVAAPHRAALANLRAIPLFLAGTACIDFAAFHYIHMIGWAVTGLSLLVVERAIEDDK